MLAGATDRAASGDLRPNQPAQGTRQPRPIPMGARTEALHRAQKRRRVDGACAIRLPHFNVTCRKSMNVQAPLMCSSACYVNHKVDMDSSASSDPSCNSVSSLPGAQRCCTRRAVSHLASSGSHRHQRVALYMGIHFKPWHCHRGIECKAGCKSRPAGSSQHSHHHSSTACSEHKARRTAYPSTGRSEYHQQHGHIFCNHWHSGREGDWVCNTSGLRQRLCHLCQPLHEHTNQYASHIHTSPNLLSALFDVYIVPASVYSGKSAFTPAAGVHAMLR